MSLIFIDVIISGIAVIPEFHFDVTKLSLFLKFYLRSLVSKKGLSVSSLCYGTYFLDWNHFKKRNNVSACSFRHVFYFVMIAQTSYSGVCHRHQQAIKSTLDGMDVSGSDS